MNKTHRVETIEEYDENGKLIRKTVTEETEETDAQVPTYSPYWDINQPYTNYTGTPDTTTTTTLRG